MVKFDKKAKEMISTNLMWGSLVAIFLSAVGYVGMDIWLASTQWLLVAVALALFGVYLKLS